MMKKVAIYLTPDVVYHVPKMSTNKKGLHVSINMSLDLSHLFIDSTVIRLVKEGQPVCLLTDNVDKYFDLYKSLENRKNFKLVTFNDFIFEGMSTYNNHVIVFEVKNCPNAQFSTVESNEQIRAYDSARKLLESMEQDAQKHDVKYAVFILDNYKGVHPGLYMRVNEAKVGSSEDFRNSFIKECSFEIEIGQNSDETMIQVRMVKFPKNQVHVRLKSYYQIRDKDKKLLYLGSLNAIDASINILEDN